MASGGAYRIESNLINQEFQAPVETSWDEQPIADGLNGIPVLSSYKIHTWQFESMLGCDYENLLALFQAQQDNNSQLDALETDYYDGTGANMKYGTQIFTDFLIKSVSPRTRGQPHYENIRVVFEVFVA